MKQYFWVINGLLICAAAYLVGVSVYKFAVPQQDAEPVKSTPVPSLAAQKAAPTKPAAHYRSITQRNLFQTGTSASEGSPKIDLNALQETKLKLKLWGTVTGPGGATWAVIEEGTSRKQQLYKEGESIQDATVRLILRNKVVLNVNGKDEVLAVEDVVSRPSIRRPVAAAGRPKARRRAITVRRSQIERISESAGDVSQQAQIKPVDDGIALTSIKPRSIFRQLRLINGDILMDVNGEKMTSTADVEKLSQYLNSSPEITLQIKRRGRPRTINYRIR